MSNLSKLLRRFNETDDQREIRLYNEQNRPPINNPSVRSNGARFVIDDVFTIAGRGTVVTGKVTRGSFSVGDTVTIDCDHSFKTVIMGIEQFRKICDSVSEGADAGILLRGVQRNQVVKGNLIIK